MKRMFVLALALPSCAVGYGPAFPGQERAREHVETRVCLETSEGCTQTREWRVSRPPRDYSALVLPMLLLGGGQTRAGDSTFTTLTTTVAAEYLRGHGPFAVGVRADAHLAHHLASHASPMSYEVSLLPVLHYGLSDQFAMYGGIGGGVAFPRNVADTPSQRGVWQGLGGMQMALLTYRGAKTLKTRVLFQLEASTSASVVDAEYGAWNLRGGFLLNL